MNAAILSRDEIIDLTGKRTHHAQRTALGRMGIPYRQRPDGSPVVGTQALATALQSNHAPSHRPAAPVSDGITWLKAA